LLALSKHQRVILTAELLAVCFMGAVAAAAHRTGVNLLLFPELAALSHDVLTRPRGKWASQPVRMILTPTLTAIAGLFITRHAHYGAIPVLLIVLASLFIIRLLRSTIAPAISAGVLPMVLDERHWMYPVAICIGLVGLVAILKIWQRYSSSIGPEPEDVEDKIIDALEADSTDRYWFVTLLTFVLVLAVIGQFTGLRFILFPPLIVMAYEIFGHPELPGWMERPALFPLVCFLTASVGLLACKGFEGGSLGVVVTVVASILLLRVFRVHMPPALAVGVLPFVIGEPDLWYPVSVGIGTIALTLWFLGRGHDRKFLKNSKTKSLTREVTEPTSGLRKSKDGHSTMVGDVSKARQSLSESPTSNAKVLLYSIQLPRLTQNVSLAGAVHQSRPWKVGRSCERVGIGTIALTLWFLGRGWLRKSLINSKESIDVKAI
jgi:hypothetical protein